MTTLQYEEKGSNEMTLDELYEKGGTEGNPIAILMGNNIGNRSLVLSVPVKTFFDISEVYNKEYLKERGEDPAQSTQRSLDKHHGNKLAEYMMKGLFHGIINGHFEVSEDEKKIAQDYLDELGDQSYYALQPIVCNLRGSNSLRLKKELGHTNVYLRARDICYVTDGQHRRYAMKFIFEFLAGIKHKKKFPKAFLHKKRGHAVLPSQLPFWERMMSIASGQWTVCVEMHIGLTPTDEKQLFHDLNSLGKKIPSQMIYSFATSHTLQPFVESFDFKAPIADVRTKQNSSALLRGQVFKISATALVGKPDPKLITPHLMDHVADRLEEFWKMLTNHPDWKTDSLMISPGFGLGVAKLYYDLRNESDPRKFEIFKENFSKLQLSWKNKIFIIHEQDDAFKNSHGSYLNLVPETSVSRNKEGAHIFASRKGDIKAVSNILKQMLQINK